MFAFLKKVTSHTKAIPIGVKLVVLVIFIRSFGWGLVDPFYSIFVEQFTKSYTKVGALIAILNFSSLLALIPLVRLADKVKDTTIMRDGEVMYFFAIICYLLAGLTGRLSFLVLAFIFNGIAYPFVIVGAETYIRKACKDRGDTESSTFSFYTALHHLGWVLGMLLAAFTVHLYDFNWMFLFILPSVLLGLWVLRYIKEEGLKSLFFGFKKYLHRRQDFTDMISDIQQVDRKTFFFLLLAFFDGILVMFTFIFIPLFAVEVGLSLKEIALLMSTAYLPFIFSYFISEATDQVSRMSVIAIGLFIGAFAFVLLSMVLSQSWILILVALNSLSIAIIRPAYNGMLTRLTPRHMLGEITGLNNIVMRLGYIVGPIASGYLADRFSLQVAFVVIASFALILAVSSLLLRKLEIIPSKKEITECDV